MAKLTSRQDAMLHRAVAQTTALTIEDRFDARVCNALEALGLGKVEYAAGERLFRINDAGREAEGNARR